MLKPIINLDYFGLPIYWIMILIGFLFAFRSLRNKQKATWCPPAIKRNTQWAFLLAMIVGGGCANMICWFLHPEYLQLTLTERFMSAGFSFYYWMLAFFGVSALLLRIMRLDVRFWLNQIVPAVLLVNIFGRVGCSLGGCCYGADVTMFGSTFAFPARELEALAALVILIVFSKTVKQHRVFWYLSCYSVFRFLLEFGRADDRGVLFITWLSPAQVTSFLVWTGLATYIVIMKFVLHKNPLETHEEAPVQEVSVPTEQKLKRFRRMKKLLAIVLVIACGLVIINPLQIPSLDSAKQSVSNVFNGIGAKRSHVETIAESNGTSLQHLSQKSVASREDALSVVQSIDLDVGGTFGFQNQQQLPSGNQLYTFHQKYNGKPIFNSGRQLIVAPDNTANYMAGETIPLHDTNNSRTRSTSKSSFQTVIEIFGENIAVTSTAEGYYYDSTAMINNTLRNVDQVAFELADGTALSALVECSSGDIISITPDSQSASFNTALSGIAQATEAFLDPQATTNTADASPEAQALNRAFMTISHNRNIDAEAFADILASSLSVAQNLSVPNLGLYREILIHECKSYYVNRGLNERDVQRRTNFIDRAMKQAGIGHVEDEPTLNIVLADTAVKIKGNINYPGDNDVMILNSEAGSAQIITITTDAPIIATITDEANVSILSMPVEQNETFKIFPTDENETYQLVVSDDPFARGIGTYSISIQPERAADKREKVPSYITTKLRQVENAYNTSRASRFVSCLHFLDSNDDALAKFIQMSGLLTVSSFFADSCMGCAGINNELMDSNKMMIAQCLFLPKELPQEIAFSLKNTRLTLTYVRHLEHGNGSFVKVAVAIGMPDAPPILKGTLYMEIRHVNNEEIARSTSEIADELGFSIDAIKEWMPNLFSGYYICDDLNSARVRNGLGVGKDELAQDEVSAYSLYELWQEKTVVAGSNNILLKVFDRSAATAKGLWRDEELNEFEAFTLRYNIGLLTYEIRKLEQENEWVALLPDLLSTGKDVREIVNDISKKSTEFIKGELAKRLGFFRMLVDPKGAIFDLMLDDMRVNAIGIIQENEASIAAIRQLIQQLNPQYNGSLIGEPHYSWTYNARSYEKDVAEMAAIFAMLAYDEYTIDSESGQYYTKDKRDKNPMPICLQSRLYAEGYRAVESRNYANKNEHDISYTLAYRFVNKDEVQVAVILRGTDSAEWRGNMDVGRGSRHESFEKANQSLQKDVLVYIREHNLANIIFFITGHSRGAAVANLFAADLNQNAAAFKSKTNNVFCYTFATPNNTTTPTKDKNIFNFTFDDDFVPQVPLAKWGFKKYGRTATASAQTLYAKDSDFKALMDSYLDLSNGRAPSFNQAATEKVLDDFYSLAPSVDTYYTKKYAMSPDHGIISGEKNQTLHGFMRNYIADAAISYWNVSAVAGSFLKSFFAVGNDVHEIAAFFIDGAGMRKSINDTHQAFTYYAALKSGGFPSPK